MPKINFPSVQYQGVGGLSPGRSVLDLSHAYSVDMKFGYLYPIVAEECVPGDVIRFGADVVARMNPSIVPFMHEVNISWHAFFVPNRLVWPKVDGSGDDWESYIVGETWDPDAGEFVPVTAVLPVWDYTDPDYYAKGSIYDYFGFQPGVVPAVGSRPHSLWNRAYLMIWNEWYRDEDLQDPLDITGFLSTGTPLQSALEKDYFTSARPFQQKGISPAIPISGLTNAVFDFGNTGEPALNVFFGSSSNQYIGNRLTGDRAGGTGVVSDLKTADTNAANDSPFSVGGVDPTGTYMRPDTLFSNNNTVDFADASTINMADLRLNMQIQKYLERNARAGNRYTEWLQSHYGVSPRDERLQRPEYLGGGKTPVIISEVLQTSESAGTPQGTLAGHGISVDRSQVVSGYRVQEFGTFMVIARILPRTMYTQGVHRRAIRNSPYEFYHPEFAHLAEQAVTKGELFVNGVNDNEVFGYQARYQEYRTRNSVAVGEMRDTLKMWNLGRSFSAVPSLNEGFISVTDSQRTQWMERAFAVTSEAPFLVSFGNRIVMSRPMPGLPEPGLMDHF